MYPTWIIEVSYAYIRWNHGHDIGWVSPVIGIWTYACHTDGYQERNTSGYSWWFWEADSLYCFIDLWALSQWYTAVSCTRQHPNIFCGIDWNCILWAPICRLCSQITSSTADCEWKFVCFSTRQRRDMASAVYWRNFSTEDRFPKSSYCFDGERQAWSGNCVIMYVCWRWDISKMCGVYSRNSKFYFVPWIYFRVWFISHKSIWYYFWNYSAY